MTEAASQWWLLTQSYIMCEKHANCSSAHDELRLKEWAKLSFRPSTVSDIYVVRWNSVTWVRKGNTNITKVDIKKM
jgi:hypothetical protein